MKNYEWKKIFKFVSDYYIKSDEKLVAWLLLIGVALSVIGLVALAAAFSWWSVGFWAALSTKALTPFLICIGQFGLLVVGAVVTNALKHFLMGALAIKWRNWLTNNLLNKTFSKEGGFLDLSRLSTSIDNPSQRIQGDIKDFVELTLMLGSDLLKAVLSLVTFTGALWVIGGPLSFVLLGLNIVIPGYLVWVALIIAITATAITYWIGKPLLNVNQQGRRVEADFRQELDTLNRESENISIEHGNSYYEKRSINKVQELQETATIKLYIQTKLTLFKSFYREISGFLPTILAAPLYFSGAIELGQLMQIGMSFWQVNSSLSWFVDTFEGFAKYQTSMHRVIELQEEYEGELISNPKSIHRKEKDKEIKIKNLSLMQPRVSSSEYMIRKLSMTMKAKEHVLIKGTSGIGKSTLFKAISGNWRYGEGKIRVPLSESLYFLPQKPTIPNDTLMGVLAYPEDVTTYTEDQYTEALTLVGGMEKFIPSLQVNANWSSELSAGQQQLIAFARAILKKPDWLFLDEATSAVDEETESHLYSQVKMTLTNTTLVSIAHRTTVDKFHDRVVCIKVNQDRDAEVEEQRVQGHFVGFD